MEAYMDNFISVTNCEGPPEDLAKDEKRTKMVVKKKKKFKSKIKLDYCCPVFHDN